MGAGIVRPADDVKSSDVLGVVFDAAQQDIGTVLLGGQFRGETGSVLERLLHDVLDASRGVVERQRASLREARRETCDTD